MHNNPPPYKNAKPSNFDGNYSINRKWTRLQRPADICCSPLLLPLCCSPAPACRKKVSPSCAVETVEETLLVCLWTCLTWSWLGSYCRDGSGCASDTLCPSAWRRHGTKMYYAPAPLFMSEQSGPWFIKQQHALPALRWREETRWLRRGILYSFLNVIWKWVQQQ